MLQVNTLSKKIRRFLPVLQVLYFTLATLHMGTQLYQTWEKSSWSKASLLRNAPVEHLELWSEQ